MSIAARVFRGYGNGTVVGTVDARVHRGYIAGEEIAAVRINRRETLRFGPDIRFLEIPRDDRTMMIPREDRDITL